ncbi:MAG: tRNA pseudouridine(38-40) synthase TruA [Paludibacteraceae bacterium]|nr:tRNA pseudouridine(38-40) synthase TruA [Paludibacteraceae bacterium]
MARYFIYISFKGTAYHGWQRQPNGISVQEKLEGALSILLNSTISVTGAGRTDAGVHASMMVAHFDTTHKLSDPLHIIHRLNRLLPADIAIKGIRLVKDDAHARFSAERRTYQYFLSTRKNPFAVETTTILTTDLDFELMNQAAQALLRHTDFTSFSKLHTDTKTNNCNVTQAVWTRSIQNPALWVFTITANRFLRNMVRAIVGTLIRVGRHQMTPSEFEGIILACNRSKAGTSAPPQGLFLSDIIYPNDVFIINDHEL